MKRVLVRRHLRLGRPVRAHFKLSPVQLWNHINDIHRTWDFQGNVKKAISEGADEDDIQQLRDAHIDTMMRRKYHS